MHQIPPRFVLLSVFFLLLTPNSSPHLQETVSDLLNHLEILGGASVGEGGFKSIGITAGGSHLSASQDHESLGENDRGSDNGSAYEIDEHSTDVSHLHLSVKANGSKNAFAGLSTAAKIKEADPTKYVSIDLKETETMFMLTIPSTTVSSEFAEESTFVKAQNAKYKELKSIIVNNDNYISKGVQALQNPVKSKEVQATGNKTVNAEVNVSQWAIYDAFAEPEKSDSQEQEGKKEVIDIEAKLGISAAGESLFSLAGASDDAASLSREQSVTGPENASVEGSSVSVSTASQQNIKKDPVVSAPLKEDMLQTVCSF